MKKVIICILIIFTFFPVFADTKLRTGSLNVIAELKQIPVFLNWSGTVYGKRGDLYNFLDKAKRSKDWEEESLFYFLREVNQRVGEYGLKLVSGKYEPDVSLSLYFEIITGHISTEGKIKGEILLKRRGSESAVAVISFESDEEDDDDEIAFKDQFESVGESFGILLKKSLRRLLKNC